MCDNMTEQDKLNLDIARAILSGDGIVSNEIIKPMLCLSTIHLKPDTIYHLKMDEIESCIWYDKIDCSSSEIYGGWLYIAEEGNSDDIEKYENLKALVDYCDARNIQWVMLDGDLARNEQLPTYPVEWRTYKP